MPTENEKLVDLRKEACNVRICLCQDIHAESQYDLDFLFCGQTVPLLHIRLQGKTVFKGGCIKETV
jgi:hypothetical protein